MSNMVHTLTNRFIGLHKRAVPHVASLNLMK